MHKPPEKRSPRVARLRWLRRLRRLLAHHRRRLWGDAAKVEVWSHLTKGGHALPEKPLRGLPRVPTRHLRLLPWSPEKPLRGLPRVPTHHLRLLPWPGKGPAAERRIELAGGARRLT
jgi:hypothetical protein